MATKYIYEGNFDPHDNTEKITGIGPDGNDVLLLGGEAKEVSDEQYAVLSTRYNIQPAGRSSSKDDGELAGEELQETARKLDITGRSEMSADELRDAVAEAQASSSSTPQASAGSPSGGSRSGRQS